MGKDNVRQHVVPRYYLAGFVDAAGQVNCLDVHTGARFATNPTNICVEKEAYSILENGVLDKSCDRINTIIEGPVSEVFTKIHADMDLSDDKLTTAVFTHLLALTANLIARSRIPRNERNMQLKKIADLLKRPPDFFDGFDNKRYLDLLRNPNNHREILEKVPILAKLAPMMVEYNEHNPKKLDTAATAESLEKLTEILYPLLTPVLTEQVAATIPEMKAKAALLCSDSINFITSDDPVIYLHNDIRVKGEQIAKPEIWTDPDRAVFIPLKPRVALYWNAKENYEAKTVDAARVADLNQQVMANCVRQVFAASPDDFLGPVKMYKKLQS